MDIRCFSRTISVVLSRTLKRCSFVLAVFSGLAAVAYFAFTGPRNLERYPGRDGSPYKLPWPAGLSWLCIQSNRGIVSHRGSEEFAFDFKMPEGSDVCAARGGTVVNVETRHHGSGMNAPNNFIVVDHGDQTRGVYLHIRQNGSTVKVGDSVAQGQKIAASGHVGRSMTPHLHFHVSSNGNTIPITFADVPTDAGIPRMFQRYTSGNR